MSLLIVSSYVGRLGIFIIARAWASRNALVSWQHIVRHSDGILLDHAVIGKEGWYFG